MSSKISQLTPTTTPSTSDEFALARSGGNYKITFDNIRKGIASYVGNTVFIDSDYGNDLTGAVESRAKPFATIGAAHTASAAYWTGGTAPSSTNIITFKIKGTFTETVTMLSYHNYDISDSDVNGVWRDNGVAAYCHIYGKGSMFNLGTSVVTITAASTILIDVHEIYGKINVTTGTVICRAYSMYNSSDNLVTNSGGSVTILDVGSILTISSAVFLTGTSGTTIFRRCQILSDNEILKTPTSANTSIVRFENCYMKTTGTNFDVVNLLTNVAGNVTLTIKDCTLIANGTGNSIDAAQATNVYIYGSNQTNLTHDTGNVTLLVGTVANGRFLIDAATI